ncbi:MAG: alternative ribosome rescue aminoacyl-tRNA hydrolase ArfB [Nocardioidaceae bacterium]|nr:alternative ribosome rescue aminoacyl-tRNA hydrolase ArfB [Nocardioidaceae bacterium]
MAAPERIPDSELTWRFSRSSGPGGQSVNTTDSRVEVRWDLARSSVLSAPERDRALARLGSRLVDGYLVVTAEEHRSQLRNRAAARSRLEAVLADAVRPTRGRRATRPTRGSQRRRLDAKTRRGQTKKLRRPPPD